MRPGSGGNLRAAGGDGDVRWGQSLKKQKSRTYLGQLLGVCQVVNSDSQEDIQERVFWGAAKEKDLHTADTVNCSPSAATTLLSPITVISR